MNYYGTAAVVVAVVAAVLLSFAAIADPYISSSSPVYEVRDIYEEVQVCTKGKDRTTEGAIIGGIIGNERGNALGGAIIGGILGDQVGAEKCKTEKRHVGKQRVQTGWNVMIRSDSGTLTTVFVPL